MSNREKFSEWLEDRINKLGWSQSDLSRESGLHRGIISKIILGASKPTPETLQAIARGLDLPIKEIYIAAGIYPSDHEADPTTEEGIHILRKLENRDKEEALRYLRFIANTGKKP